MGNAVTFFRGQFPQNWGRGVILPSSMGGERRREAGRQRVRRERHAGCPRADASGAAAIWTWPSASRKFRPPACRLASAPPTLMKRSSPGQVGLVRVVQPGRARDEAARRLGNEHGQTGRAAKADSGIPPGAAFCGRVEVQEEWVSGKTCSTHDRGGRPQRRRRRAGEHARRMGIGVGGPGPAGIIIGVSGSGRASRCPASASSRCPPRRG